MSICAMWIACVIFFNYLTKLPVALAMQQKGKYDNNNPREQQASLNGWGKRALAAHKNSFEVCPLYCIALLCAGLSSVEATKIHLVSIIFLACRSFYTFLYIRDMAPMRSMVWACSIFCIFYLLFQCST